MNRTIIGKIDEFGFIYFNVSVVNPLNKKHAINVKAIIDTGAHKSLIKMDLIEYLKLKSIEESEYFNPTLGKVKTGLYNLELLFDSIKIESIDVKLLADPGYPCAFIIGMDIIKLFDFSYKAQTKTFEMTYSND